MKVKKKMGALCEEGTENLIDPAYIENLAPEEWQVDEIGLRTWKITALVDAPSYRYPVRSNYVWIPENQTATLSVYLLDRSASYMAIRVSGFSELGQIEDGRWRLTKAHSAEWAYQICYVNNFAEVKKGDYIIVKDPQIEMGSYPTSISDGTRAPSLLRYPLPIPLPSDNFGIGLSAKMLHESAAKDRTFWQAGGLGGALEFDGVEDYVQMPSLSAIGDKTFEAWVKLHSKDANVVICHWKTGGEGLVGGYAQTRDGLMFSRANDNSRSRKAHKDYVPLNEWFHLAVVKSANTIEKIYINGIDRTITSDSNFTTDYGDRFLIGCRYCQSARSVYLNGELDDVRIWNIARTQQQIADNMHRELTGDETGLIGYWKFNEGAGATAHDSAGSNHGTIYGATWTDGIIPAGYRCFFDTVDNKLKITNGTATAEIPASWDAEDIVGVYAGRRDGKLFIQSKIAGALIDIEEAAGDAVGGINTITIGSNSGGESGHVNAVIADFKYDFTAKKIDPAGYLGRVPGGGE